MEGRDSHETEAEREPRRIVDAAELLNLAFEDTGSPHSEAPESASSLSDVNESGVFRRQSLRLQPGDKLEHFTIVEELGRGGMGTVYRAMDESLKREVAVKVMDAGDSGIDQVTKLESLLQEAQSQARLSHPNVVPIYYVQPRPRLRHPFFTMGYVCGPTLSERLRGGTLEFGSALDVTIQVTRALQHAFANGILHGDVKPGNVLFASDGTAKLADFGLARSLDDDNDSEKFSGTPAYMAPELIAGEASGFASDVFALGVTLFQMTLGRLPFAVDPKDAKAVFDAHLSSEPAFPEEWPSTLPRGLQELLSRMLARNPADRYPDYETLLEALEALRPQSPPAATHGLRLAAWTIDFAFWAGIYLAAFSSGALFLQEKASLLASYHDPKGIASSFVILLSIVVPVAACLAHGYWRTTLGGSLFQLRVVDGHGKQPSRRTMAMRTALRLVPLIILCTYPALQVLGLSSLGSAYVGLGLVFTFANFSAAVFTSERHALHDVVCNTRLGINTRPKAGR